jgi:WD40 repeat protein
MRLFNADSGAAINANPAQVGELTALAVSPDGQLIYTGGENGSLQLWDAHSGELRRTINVSGDQGLWIEDLALDGDGQKLAVAGRGGEIAIYDTKSLQPHGPNLEPRGADGAPSHVSRIAFSPDGHTLAAAGDDLQMWDVDAAKLVHRARLGTSDTAQATAVAFSRDGHRVATGSNRGAVQLWDADTPAPFGPTMSGHKGFVQAMAFSPDGRHLATSSLDGTLRVWSATIGQPMRGPDPFLTQTAFSPDGQRVAAAGDTAIQQWDVRTGFALPPQLPGGVGTKWFSYVANNRMVTAAQDGTTQMFDDATGRPIAPPVRLSLADGYNNFAASGDGRIIAAGQRSSGTVQLWEVATGKAVRQPITIDTRNDPVKQEALLALTFSPDGHRLGGAYKGGPRLWNIDSAHAEDALMVDPANRVNPIMSVAFSGDGDTLVAGSFESVELWDSANRKQLPRSPLRGHDGLVASVAFGVGHQLASGGVDATLRLWDTATGKPTASPVVEPDSVVSVAISPDGRLVASANADGSLLLSPAIADTAQLCDKLGSNMSHKQWRDWVSPGVDYVELCPGLPVAAD